MSETPWLTNAIALLFSVSRVQETLISKAAVCTNVSRHLAPFFLETYFSRREICEKQQPTSNKNVTIGVSLADGLVGLPTIIRKHKERLFQCIKRSNAFYKTWYARQQEKGLNKKEKNSANLPATAVSVKCNRKLATTARLASAPLQYRVRVKNKERLKEPGYDTVCRSCFPVSLVVLGTMTRKVTTKLKTNKLWGLLNRGVHRTRFSFHLRMKSKVDFRVRRAGLFLTVLYATLVIRAKFRWSFAFVGL